MGENERIKYKSEATTRVRHFPPVFFVPWGLGGVLIQRPLGGIFPEGQLNTVCLQPLSHPVLDIVDNQLQGSSNPVPSIAGAPNVIQCKPPSINFSVVTSNAKFDMLTRKIPILEVF